MSAARLRGERCRIGVCSFGRAALTEPDCILCRVQAVSAIRQIVSLFHHSATLKSFRPAMRQYGLGLRITCTKGIGTNDSYVLHYVPETNLQVHSLHLIPPPRNCLRLLLLLQYFIKPYHERKTHLHPCSTLHSICGSKQRLCSR